MFEDAIIHMGLMPNEFWDMTLYEYRCIICRFRFNQSRHAEHTRKIEVAIRNSVSTKSIQPTDWYSLLTDPKPKKPKTVDPKERERLRQAAIDTAAIFTHQMNK